MNILDYIREKRRVWRLHHDPRWRKFEEWTRAYNRPGEVISFSYWVEVLGEGENELGKKWARRATNKN